ncbi:sugar transferase [Clostridium sp. C8]|jgi:lipopolysaccharide/colanic/teichoic acid biosynthesis glycosyltransferase|nr:sugar transferase [Clostridium sp. C8]KLE14604.1 exopolysaccharide biosynthesis protein [Clostridium sp. C8]
MQESNLQNQQIEIQIEELREKKLYELSKRVLDIISSIIGLILLSPIIIIIWIIIKFDSKGPAIYSHIRLGKEMRPIKVYKFRSMYQNSAEIFENFTSEQKKEYYENFKLDNDPRITKIGAFLRKTSLDELPQLINIIRGDMSVVGPRPIVEDEVEKYGVYANKFFSVIPGLTGYWQANGRSDTSYDERVQMDMFYIDNRSLLMDFKIILKTMVSVVKKEGAI